MTSQLPTSPDALRQIADWLSEAGLDTIEITSPECSLRIVAARNGTAAAPLTSIDPQRQLAPITSERVGVFQSTHPLRTAPFVHAGDCVTPGQIVGLLRVGGLYHPVMAHCDGVVATVHVADGQAVGYGTRLFDLERP